MKAATIHGVITVVLALNGCGGGDAGDGDSSGAGGPGGSSTTGGSLDVPTTETGASGPSGTSTSESAETTTGEPSVTTSTSEPTDPPTTTGGTTTSTPGFQVPGELSLAGEAWPEDVAVFGNRVFVTNFVSGGIQTYDLEMRPGVAEVFVPGPVEGNLKSFWGLRPVPAKGWLLAVANINYALDNMVSEPGVVHAYDIETGAEVAAWTLPVGTVGNSIDVDLQGNIYVGDVTQAGRIVKVDPETDAVTVWKDNSDWGQGQFGIGGMVFDGEDSLYATVQGGIWRVPVEPNGDAGEPVKLALVDGDDVVLTDVKADGMAMADPSTIYFAQNDVFAAGAHGVVFKLALTGGDAGTVTPFAQDLTDCSGVAFATVQDTGYLFVNESQFGHLFKVDPGPPGPFRVLVLPTL